MKIAITGGKGFVGSNLIKIIDKKNNKISVLTRSNNEIMEGVEYIKTDYHSEKSVLMAISGADIIIHLAATLFARNKNEFIKENVESTKNLVNLANISGVKKFIYISSLAAGGPSTDSTNPRKETDKENPVSNYGLSKLLSEKEVMRFKNDWVILRPPIVYGPKDDGFSTIAQWLKKGIMISPLSKDAMFSFVFVKDLCLSIIRVIESDIKNDIFYICEDKIYKWTDFINMMADYMEVKRPKIIKMPKALLNLTAISYEFFSYIIKTKPILNRDKVREASFYHWIASSKKWQDLTAMKWTPLSEGLKKTFEKNLV